MVKPNLLAVLLITVHYPVSPMSLSRYVSTDIKLTSGVFPNRANTGESILYLWVEKVREFLLEKSQSTDTGENRMSCLIDSMLYFFTRGQ